MNLRRVYLDGLTGTERQALTRRTAVPDSDVRLRAAAIVRSVRDEGDAALVDLGRRIGGGRPDGLRVPTAESESALERLAPDLLRAIEAAADNIRRFHESLSPKDVAVEVRPGVSIARAWAPLKRVGIYIPGGSAPYLSTLLMTVIPARVAGVGQIAVASPAAPDGTMSPELLGTAAWLGVTEFYVMGGAQAIGALAYGTDTVMPVEKIVGPGNQWVTAAKLAVTGDCAIDLPAGPSESLILADGSVDPRWIAADLLCQAEHGPDSQVVLVTTDPELPDKVDRAAADLLTGLDRKDIIEKSLNGHAFIALARDRMEAIGFANDFAAEHVSVLTADSEADARLITAAGSVFVGKWSSESAGDYCTGANHVLPTGGLARSSSPLSVEDFGSWRQVQTLSREGLAALRPTIATLAGVEGLTAHLLASEIRFEGSA